MAPTWHGDLPWRELLRAYRWVRRLGFTKTRPGGPYVRTTVPLDTLRELLGGTGYAPGWKFSYDKGEDLNLAWVYHDANSGEWRQVHVRVWDDGEHRYLSAHDELTPEEHPKAHLQGDGFDRDEGIAQLQADLGALAVPFDVVDW